MIHKSPMRSPQKIARRLKGFMTRHHSNGKHSSSDPTNNILKPTLDDTQQFRKYGKELVDFIADYHENIRNYPAVPNVKPGWYAHSHAGRGTTTTRKLAQCNGGYKQSHF